MKEYEKVTIESARELRDWLEENHQTRGTTWLVRWKKASGKPYISYEEIVDQLICFGWVDSHTRKLNDAQSMLLISPRNPKSNWSGSNKERVERLSKLGLMKPTGLDLVEHAKKTGTWNFLDEVEKGVIPPDLAQALKSHQKAEYYFNRFPDSSKRGILEWIKSAKRKESREKRINETARKASENIKANHPEGRDAGPAE